jgi:uncharacterized membrane protein
MTPGIELAERIEQAQILVIVHARSVLADRTTQRDDAQPMRALRREGRDRVADLQRTLAVTDQQPEGRLPIHTADEVLNKLRSLQKEYLIDLEDACVVERDKGGKIHIKQAVNLAGVGAAMGGLRGAMWGTLVGLLFLNPLAGMAIGGIAGAGVGALSGSLTDYGIRDDFIRKLGETIPEGSSALFVLFRSVTEDKVLPEIEPYKPRVLKTSLSNEAEEKLRAALSKGA